MGRDARWWKLRLPGTAAAGRAAARLGRLLRARGQHEELEPHAAYERWASTYGDVPNVLQRLEAEMLVHLMPPMQGECFLDLGCGKARLSRLVLRAGAARSVAVDFSLAMLSAPAAFRAPELRRVQADAVKLPFSSHSFGVVGAALMLGHSPELSLPLAEMCRVLRPGGWLLVSDFHPAATRRGWERSFTDPGTGRTFAIRQYAHPLSRYRAVLGNLGLVIETVKERDFEGRPVVFALLARLRPSATLQTPGFPHPGQAEKKGIGWVRASGHTAR